MNNHNYEEEQELIESILIKEKYPISFILYMFFFSESFIVSNHIIL